MFRRPINNGLFNSPARAVVSHRLDFARICLSLSAAIWLSGCQKKELPPVAYIGPTLTVADLEAGPAPCPATGFTVVEKQSRGVFPGALAVAFLSRGGAEAAEGGWSICALREEEATWWNQLFNTAPVMREVMVMDPLSLVSPEDNQAAIVATARRLKADLCLLYGHAPAPAGEVALTGVIRETQQGKIMAIIRAHASPSDFAAHRPDTLEQDQRNEDVNYIVARRFEQQTRRCVLQLIAQDTPVTTTQPSPWRDYKDPTKPAYIFPDRQINY